MYRSSETVCEFAVFREDVMIIMAIDHVVVC
jgi:hypothetical protein